MKNKYLVFYLLLVYGIFQFCNLVVQEIRLQNYQSRLELDKSAVLSEQSKLKESLDYYQTDIGVEELARQRLGYHRRDEISIRVIEAPQKDLLSKN